MKCAACGEYEATEYDLLCKKCCVPFGGASVLVIPMMQKIAARIAELEDQLLAAQTQLAATEMFK